jgi:hypothetical protein
VPRKNFEKTTKQLLPVKFTDDELQAIGLQLAAVHVNIGELTVQKKIESDRFKDLIDAATSEAGRLAANRVNGCENRYVDCTTTYDFKKGTKRSVRLDTGEVVAEGPMTDEELKLAQMAFEDARDESHRDEAR